MLKILAKSFCNAIVCFNKPACTQMPCANIRIDGLPGNVSGAWDRQPQDLIYEHRRELITWNILSGHYESLRTHITDMKVRWNIQ